MSSNAAARNHDSVISILLSSAIACTGNRFKVFRLNMDNVKSLDARMGTSDSRKGTSARMLRKAYLSGLVEYGLARLLCSCVPHLQRGSAAASIWVKSKPGQA